MSNGMARGPLDEFALRQSTIAVAIPMEGKASGSDIGCQPLCAYAVCYA